MLKDFCFTGFRVTGTLAAALVSFLPGIAHSIPSAGTLSPATSDANFNPPLCYLQTSDGRILDLGKLCEKTAPDTAMTANINRNPVGANGCYLFDAAGRRCPTSTSDRN